MIFKFCFKNEIHRCSEPPADFSSLLSLLKTTFKAELPKEFTLHYILPGTENQVSLSSQEGYQSLLERNDTKTIKIYITEAEEAKDRLNSSEYDVISMPNKNEDNIEEAKVGEVKQDKPNLESVVKNVTESVVMPQVQKLPYFSYMPMQDEHLQKMIRDIVQEQIPVIVSRVKEAVLQELRVSRPKEEEPQRVEILRQEVIQQNPVQLEEPVPKEIIRNDDKEDFKYDENAFQRIEQEKNKKNILDHLKKIGNSIKEHVVELPEKVKNAIDEWSHRIEEDPYVQIEEGRYPKSVIEKAQQMKEVFIDESLKDLLEFVKKYPRTVNLQQLAHMFIVKDQPQEEEEPEEVVEFQQQKENEVKEQRLDDEH